MKREELGGYLKGGLFISAMMGETSGEFVARHGKGARMVQIGALVADALDRSHEPDYLLPLTEDEMVPVLRKEVEEARRLLGETPIALNAAPGDIESGLRMARAFHKAGGDIFELNVHGGYEKLLKRGLLRAMALPENRPRLIEWLKGLCRLEIPIVVKFRAGMEGVDFIDVLEEIAAVEGLFGVHFNVRSEEKKAPDFAFVRQVRPHIKGLLFCSGYVRDLRQVNALFEAGADCVGIAQGILDEPDIIARLSNGR